ncbi:MAG: alanine:cation symporter family protein [Treponema sp.]|nr:alanine:cation symporter family protein [Treponema sp.]
MSNNGAVGIARGLFSNESGMGSAPPIPVFPAAHG